ncbi:hypothetical protein BDP55DRAFT_637521 [Colletotrichum godetiae]|uniref:Uncharacterized protein n=1 Tax=Colletotrichum godetiae TaxID=1209918 RepID=A0AAJ0A977_9PEZI|nr:uncharacterized protein BDP55DRAFT_637521 [Colletotrichum godetiae]KAK1658866.1 hypothetical protein BDP55DRAFT_637521 [Colletotrichum godetiae]
MAKRLTVYGYLGAVLSPNFPSSSRKTGQVVPSTNTYCGVQGVVELARLGYRHEECGAQPFQTCSPAQHSPNASRPVRAHRVYSAGLPLDVAKIGFLVIAPFLGRKLRLTVYPKMMNP